MVREGANKIMVTEDGQIVGIITIMDILGDIEEGEREELVEKLARPPMPIAEHIKSFPSSGICQNVGHSSPECL